MRRRIVVLGASGMLALAACSSGGSKGAAPASGSATAQPVPKDGVRTIALSGMQNDKFNLATIYTSSGPLRVEYTVSGPTPHNFEVEGVAGSKSDLISNGQTKVLNFNVSPGTYTYVCTIHDGMKGKLVVTAS